MRSLNDKVVVISGSTRGIGRAIAKKFASTGSHVVVNGRKSSQVEQVVAELRESGGSATGLAVDICRFDDCDRLVEHCIQSFGRLDYVINNAGISMEGDVVDLAPEVFHKVIETNLIGSCYLTKAAIEHLKTAQGGIVFVSSCASFVGIPGYSVYCASKMAMEGFAESLKLELAPFGVYVGIAQVGFTKNDQDKTILGTNGELVPQPARPFVQPDTQESVADQIAMMIDSRKGKHVFGSMGKAASLLSRFAPNIYEMILKRHYTKSQKENIVPPIDCGETFPGQNLANS